jgi:hypothetical protein
MVRVKSEIEVRVKNEIEVRVKIFSAKCLFIFFTSSAKTKFSVFYLFITKPNNSAFVEVLS